MPSTTHKRYLSLVTEMKTCCFQLYEDLCINTMVIVITLRILNVKEEYSFQFLNIVEKDFDPRITAKNLILGFGNSNRGIYMVE